MANPPLPSFDSHCREEMSQSHNVVEGQMKCQKVLFCFPASPISRFGIARASPRSWTSSRRAKKEAEQKDEHPTTRKSISSRLLRSLVSRCTHPIADGVFQFWGAACKSLSVGKRSAALSMLKHKPRGDTACQCHLPMTRLGEIWLSNLSLLLLMMGRTH